MTDLIPPKIDTRPLVEAPMESPLNLAHTFSRRADMLTKNRKYEEAITCHRKAAEYLLEAMQSAKSATLQESMALQHKAYLSEITRLQYKNQLLELMDRNTKTSAVISQATQTDGINNMDTTEQVTMDEDSIYEVLRENDDVMNRLSVKSAPEKDNTPANGGSTQAPGSSESIIGNIVSMEEVVSVNKKLSQAVRSLLQELGSTQAEKRQMAEKLGDSAEILKQGFDEELKFYSLDLPPLEVSYPELAMLKMDS
ncbi:nuclear receptor-binding factor 2 [Aplysia californica]|uniref:Nuclear receptor-binding factor 2 n=1 Tax=Aplysia californica TaxID=6500 RepID=A0ABM0JFU0_APLCA|nr:nuclear receptor-binding factor 2 [Aplysia californica]